VPFSGPARSDISDATDARMTQRRGTARADRFVTESLERDGYYVVYHLASEQVHALGSAITRFLDH